MNSIFAEKALLPSGWERQVEISVNSQGRIESVACGKSGNASETHVACLIPGMPNLHSHAFQRAMAGLAEYRAQSDDNFWSWREAMYRFSGNIDTASLKAIASQLYTEMLESGYTAVAEFHYLHFLKDSVAMGDPMKAAEAILEAAEEVGMGITLCPVLYLQGGFGGQSLGKRQQRFHLKLDAYVSFLEALRGKLEPRGHQLGMAFHSLRAVPHAALKDALSHWKRINPNGPIHIHIAEQTGEVDQCLAWSGKRPVRWLLDEVGIDENWCLVHATHLAADEVRDLAQSGAVAGLCPTTEANLGDGFFEILDYGEAGGKWGIGSDSHISVSPIEDLRLLEYGARLRYRKRNLIAHEKQAHVGAHLWDAAVHGGQGPLGRRQTPMTPGAIADFIALDTQHPALFDRADATLMDALIFSGNQSPIEAVMAKGKWVVREGRHLRKEAIAESYRSALRSLAAEGASSP